MFFYKKVINKCLCSFSYVLITLAILACALRLSTPLLAKYKPEIERHLSGVLHNNIHIGSLNASWYGAEPVVRLNDVVIKTLNTNKELISVKRFSLGLNIWQSLISFSLQPGTFVLEGAKLQVFKNKSDQFQIKGINALTINQQPSLDKEDVIPQNILNWLINQNELRISNVSVQFKTLKGSVNTIISSLKLIKEGTYHKFEGGVKFQNISHTKLRLVGKWQGEQLNRLSGKFYSSISNFPLALINEVLPIKGGSVKSGQGTINLWGELGANLSLSSEGNIRLEKVEIENTKTKKIKKIKFLKSAISYFHSNKKTKLLFKHLEFSPYLKFNKEHSFLWQKKGKNSFVQFSYANLSAVDEWVSFIDPEFYTQLQSNHFHGALKNIKLDFFDDKPQWISGEFENLGAHNHDYLSFNNLSGDFSFDSQHGFLNLTSRNASFYLPEPLNKTLTVNDLKGGYYWRKIADFWRISSDNSFFSLDNIVLSNQFLLDWKGSFKRSYLALGIDFSGNKIEELSPYLPQKGMSDKLKRWLEMALVSVPNVSGHFTLRGILGDFPFDNTKGTLQANLYAQNATLNYHPLWPIATELDANLYLDKRIMSASITKAMVDNNAVSDLSILIKPLGTEKQRLYLKIKDQYSAPKLVNFLMNTPLKNKLNLLSSMTFHKNIDLDLNLIIPLYENAVNKPILGSVLFKNNTVNVFTSPNIELTSVNGSLLFNERGIINSQLSAKLLSYPLSLSLDNQKGASKGLMVLGKGKISLEKLKKEYPFLPLADFEGLLTYKGSLFFPDDKPFTLVELVSKLRHVQNHLPSPLSTSKREDALLISSKIKSNEFSLDLTVINKLKSRFNFKKNKDAYYLEKGILSFDNKKISLPQEKVMKIEGKIKRLSTSSWYEWYMKKSTDNNISSLPVIADLMIDTLEFNEQKYNNVLIGYRPVSQGTLLKINSRQVKGEITFPEKSFKEEVKIKLDHLHIGSNASVKNKRIDRTLGLPPLSVDIKKFTYKGNFLGKLQGKSKVLNNIFLIDSLSLSSPLYLLKLTGQWTQNNNKSDLLLEGFIQSDHLSKGLDQWGMPPVIESKKSLLTFKLKAKKGLSALKLKDFYGKLSLKLLNGRITHLSEEVEKSLGLGKLISILSLQTLPRRLTLDFTDLSKDGFSFDVLKGDFNLSEGRLLTKNSYLDGPVSFVRMEGALNILKKDYDLTLKIVPHITASLPVVATIAGGPIAGIAAWVASKIINKGIQKVSSYTYKIIGPWEHPVVHQVNISKSKKIIK